MSMKQLLNDAGIPRSDLTEKELKAICCGPDLPERPLARYIWRMSFLHVIPPWIDPKVYNEHMTSYVKKHWLVGDLCNVCKRGRYRTQQPDLSAGITCPGGHSQAQHEAAAVRKEPEEEGFV